MEAKYIRSEKPIRIFLMYLIGIELLLVFIYCLILKIDNPPVKLRMLFHLDYEENIPTFFSSVQLVIIGATFLSIIPILKKYKITTIKFLVAAGLGFTFLAFDEFFMLHEKFAENFRQFEFMPRFSHNHGVWILPYVFAVVLLLFILRKGIVLLFKNKLKETIIISFGIGLFLVGALGLEIISYQVLRYNESFQYLYKYEVAFEDFFEMLGMSIVLYGALLLKLKRKEVTVL